MKKVLSIILCAALALAGVLAFSGCTKQESNTDPEVINTGGWTRADSPVITDEINELLGKAVKGMVGAKYTPVAYIASQVVAGTNHCILCKVAAVVPEAVSEYKLVYIYEDLEGNAEITNVIETGVKADYANNDGGWGESASPVITEDAKTAFDKATEMLTGAEYTPIALLATQVVAGFNYSILCEAKATVPDAEAYYVIVTVYADLDGNAEITETNEIQV